MLSLCAVFKALLRIKDELSPNGILELVKSRETGGSLQKCSQGIAGEVLVGSGIMQMALKLK